MNATERDRPAGSGRGDICANGRSAARLILTVAKYTGLTLAGIMLFRAGQARGLIDRGYAAIGGEVFTLFLPAYYFIISKLARDVIADKQGNSKNN